MNVKNDNNKLYTISKIHRATYEFKPEQHGLLKRQRLGQGPRKKKHSFLTGHIRRVLVVKCNYLCIYLKCLLEFCFKILFFFNFFFFIDPTTVEFITIILPLWNFHRCSKYSNLKKKFWCIIFNYNKFSYIIKCYEKGTAE